MAFTAYRFAFTNSVFPDSTSCAVRSTFELMLSVKKSQNLKFKVK